MGSLFTTGEYPNWRRSCQRVWIFCRLPPVRFRLAIVLASLALVALLAGGASARSAFNLNGLPFTATEGIKFTGTVANFDDVHGASYKVTIDWGDGTAESEGQAVPTGKTTYDVTGSHNYVDEGTFNLHVTVLGTSGGGGSGQSSPVATVLDAPVVVKGGPAFGSLTEGGTVNGVVATFTDANTGGDTGDCTASIDWGDGSSANGTIARTGLGQYSVTASHTFGEEGKPKVKITVVDKGGSRDATTPDITVADAPLGAGPAVTRRGSEGHALAGVVGTFKDPYTAAPASDYTATINWGDHTSSAGTITGAGGNWSVQGTHTYREEGNFTTTVAVADHGGSTVTLHGNSLIRDAAIRAIGRRIATARAFRGIVATFTDGNPAAKASDFAASIEWGDGTVSIGRIAKTGRRFSVSAAHRFKQGGLHLVVVHLRDRGGSVATARTRLRVG
jgi:hypothetical protein